MMRKAIIFALAALSTGSAASVYANVDPEPSSHDAAFQAAKRLGAACYNEGLQTGRLRAAVEIAKDQGLKVDPKVLRLAYLPPTEGCAGESK